MNSRTKTRLRSLLPRTVRRWPILSGPLRGRSIVTSWHDYPAAILGRTERPLLEWFQKNVRPGETWLDIGAHYGYTAIALSRLVGASGRVFAFEPALGTVGYLSQTRVLNNLPQLTIVPMGLATPTDLALHRLPIVRGMVDSTVAAGAWMEPLVVARLDWLWPRVSGGRDEVHGIKIDVQGMEIEVLRGMLSMLRTAQPKLVVEVHTGVDRRVLRTLLREAGFAAPGLPIDGPAVDGEEVYFDDRSYFFEKDNR